MKKERIIRAGSDFLLGLLLVLLIVGCSPSHWVRSEKGTGPSIPPRHTLKELRDYAVVKQDLDYSCGTAALATLMIYYFGEKTSEQELLELLKARFTPEEWEAKLIRGFSLLDLKHVAQAKGYQAAGFRLTIEQLAQLRAPVIVHLQPLGYKHFAVFRGMDRGRAYLADPARGNLRMSLARFRSEWTGVIFVLAKAGEESITSYPLALPHPEHIQPEILRVLPILDLGMFARDLGVRIGVK